MLRRERTPITNGLREPAAWRDGRIDQHFQFPADERVIDIDIGFRLDGASQKAAQVHEGASAADGAGIVSRFADAFAIPTQHCIQQRYAMN